MTSRDRFRPVPMTRIAVVAPRTGLRDALVQVAGAGCVEFDTGGPGDAPAADDAARRLHRLDPQHPALSPVPPDLEVLERQRRADLLAGEVQLAGYAAQAGVRGQVAALAGWTPRSALAGLRDRLAPVGAAVVPLPTPRGVDPPTALPADRYRAAFAPLVDTYATVPYADVDPTLLAGLAYVVMFGAMFGDAGHGLLLLLAGLLLRAGRPRRLARLAPHWPLVAGAGAAATGFGLLYGEFFGPTGVVPALGIAPMEEPVRLLAAGVGLGAVLLAGAYAVGTANRVREGGWSLALYAPAGLAGALLFLAAGIAALAWWRGLPWLGAAAGGISLVALALAFAGLLAGAGGGAAAAAQAVIELVDVVIRLGTNVLSFARLAAFGLTHAVLGWIVWTAASRLAGGGPAAIAGAVVVFVVGNVLTFGLEALVAGVQALRLEYYELFSKVFQIEGRPFRPWHVPPAGAPEEKGS
jgi:V/A-type H+-transporting ATPase subunit I